MDLELKMRSDPERSRSARRSKSSWLICAWISETILSQLIADVAPHNRIALMSLRAYLNLVALLGCSRQRLAFAHDIHCQNFGAASGGANSAGRGADRHHQIKVASSGSRIPDAGGAHCLNCLPGGPARAMTALRSREFVRIFARRNGITGPQCRLSG